MKADNCVGIKDAVGIAFPNGSTDAGNHHGKYGFVIPAGALIGLGVGSLVGHVGSGALIGVGLGFLASELILFVRKPLESEGHAGGTNGTLLLIGAFLIFVGISLALAPAVLWPYAIPGFFILLGIWSLVRGFYACS
ncbi:MAG: hypothetical protein ABFC89_00275 [Methanospirillum sp.]